MKKFFPLTVVHECSLGEARRDDCERVRRRAAFKGEKGKAMEATESDELEFSIDVLTRGFY